MQVVSIAGHHDRGLSGLGQEPGKKGFGEKGQIAGQQKDPITVCVRQTRGEGTQRPHIGSVVPA